MSKPNTLYYGDCLEWMETWPDGFVDLIYLDPPFNSKRDYNVFLRGAPEEQAQFRAFTDTWYWDEKAVERYRAIADAIAHPLHGCVTGLHSIIGECGMLAYLTYMGERLLPMKRLLKDTGSIWLHCDPTASHYLKVMMDAVFGGDNCRNEVIWCYTGPGSPGMRQFNRKHDNLFWYSVGKTWTFNAEQVRVPHKQLNTNKRGAMIAEPMTDDLRDDYLKKGKIPETWWPDFTPVGRIKNERLGYPTQKPKALLDRIIRASSKQGDLVLDPFCGCGTTMAAAEELGRKWMGIDISSNAVRLVRDERLKNKRIRMEGIPADMAGAKRLSEDHPLQFETWAVELLPGFAPNSKQTGDGGIDGQGITADPVSGPGGKQVAVMQVKGGRFQISQLRDFAHVIERQKAAFGVFLTLRKVESRNARAEAAGLGKVQIGQHEYPKLQMYSVQEYFDDRLPSLPVMLNPYTGKPVHADLFDEAE